LFDKLDRFFYPAGASARIAFMFLKPAGGDLGLELAPAWNMLDTGAVTIHMYPLHVNGIYQFWLPSQKAALVFRLGGGITFAWGTNNDSENADPFFTWILLAAGEIVFRWYPAANARQTGHAFYIEAGAGYTHVFSVDSPSPGYIKPILGVGWRF
jgi:hypothetical protein